MKNVKRILGTGCAVALIGAGLSFGSALPAQASGSNCTTDTVYEPTSFPEVPDHWVGRAYCSSGTGWFRVTVTCTAGDGGTYFDERATAKPSGGGQYSRMDCAGGHQPLSVGYSTWD